MHREAHYWYSRRLGREMGVVVFGHWGPPLIAFPTTGGDEWEYERQGVIGAIAGAIAPEIRIATPRKIIRHVSSADCSW